MLNRFQNRLLKDLGDFSNYRNWKNLRQTPQVDDQRQAILMPQHPAAVRYFGRGLIEQRILGC
jgi:hypothetical protein